MGRVLAGGSNLDACNLRRCRCVPRRYSRRHGIRYRNTPEARLERRLNADRRRQRRKLTLAARTTNQFPVQRYERPH